MNKPNVIVLVFDRLGAGWLGPYGTSWIATPAFNELAAESLLCEFMLSDSTRLDHTYRSYWQGLPAHSRVSHTPWVSLPELAKQAGLEPWLVTDEPQLLDFPAALQFHEQVLVRSAPPTRSASEIAKTQLADLLTIAAEQLTSSPQPKLLWVHAAAMQAAWDAPYEYCEQFTGEDDPPPPKLFLPPQHTFATKPDPDELLGYVHSYAGQVVTLDACLGSFRDELAKQIDIENTWLIVTSPRGYPLGEHRIVGEKGDALRGEVLQVPFILRMPKREQQLTRLNSLHQPVDLFATLAGICDTKLTGGLDLRQVATDELAPSPLAIAWTENEQALRTPAWFYRQAKNGDELQQELYVKPDDRWEVNEISARAANVVAEFETLWQQVEAQRDSLDRVNIDLPETLKQSSA